MKKRFNVVWNVLDWQESSGMFPATESKKNQSIPNLANLIMLNKSHCGEWKIEVLTFLKCLG
jgi:hypothetical protein